jgi:hypothetical protein
MIYWLNVGFTPLLVIYGSPEKKVHVFYIIITWCSWYVFCNFFLHFNLFIRKHLNEWTKTLVIICRWSSKKIMVLISFRSDFKYGHHGIFCFGLSDLINCSLGTTVLIELKLYGNGLWMVLKNIFLIFLWSYIQYGHHWK